MTNHITEIQMERFCARALEVTELVAIAEHLSLCRACQESFQQTIARRREFAPLAFTFAPVEWVKHEHLEYEQIASYIEGEIDSAEREIAELHLSVCAACREDIKSLRAFRAEIAPEIVVSYQPVQRERQERKGFFFGFLPVFIWKPVCASIAVFVILVSIIIFISRSHHGSLGGQQARNFYPQETHISTSPSTDQNTVKNDSLENRKKNDPKNLTGNLADNDPSTSKSLREKLKAGSVASHGSVEGNKLPFASSATTIILDDESARFAVDKTGKVQGLSNVPPALRQEVERILLAQNFERSAPIFEVNGESSILRSPMENKPPFNLLSPIRMVIVDTRPVFRWEGLKGASGYRVFISDSKGREVATSPQLSLTEWQPSDPLKRGETYSWSVVATVGDEETVSPAAATREVKFRILSSEQLSELDQLRQRTSSHLVLGVFYARLGMISEAEREFQNLLALNPRSLLAQKLVRRVQSWR
jgi:hypothetical protein